MEVLRIGGMGGDVGNYLYGIASAQRGLTSVFQHRQLGFPMGQELDGVLFEGFLRSENRYKSLVAFTDKQADSKSIMRY
jgi:hypothetical protein